MGYISGVFGVHGWVKIYSYTEPRDNVLYMLPWYLKKGTECYRIVAVTGREQGNGLVVAHLGGCGDRDDAQKLVGAAVWVEKSQLPVLGEHEYYWSDLIGLSVWSGDVLLGQVAGMIETGANDVLVIEGDRERLVPFIQPDVVKTVDIPNGRMDVDWDPEF